MNASFNIASALEPFTVHVSMKEAIAAKVTECAENGETVSKKRARAMVIIDRRKNAENLADTIGQNAEHCDLNARTFKKSAVVYISNRLDNDAAALPPARKGSKAKAKKLADKLLADAEELADKTSKKALADKAKELGLTVESKANKVQIASEIILAVAKAA